MRRIRVAHTMITAGGLLVASLVVVPQATIRAQTPGYIARVLSVVTYPLDQQEFSALTSEDRSKLQQQGVQVIDQSRELRSPSLGLSGFWLEFGTRRYMTETDGSVRLATLPASTTSIKVYAQLGDKTPVGTLPKINFVPEGQLPEPSTLLLTYKLPANMDPPAASPSVLIPGPAPPPPPACPRRTPCAAGNGKGCCLDYNGPPPIGDGIPYVRQSPPQCLFKVLRNFIGST
jgi:hypothetical protein